MCFSFSYIKSHIIQSETKASIITKLLMAQNDILSKKIDKMTEDTAQIIRMFLDQSVVNSSPTGKSQSVSVKSPLEKIPTLIIEPVIEPIRLRNAFDVLGSRDPLHIMSIAANYVVNTLKGLACFTAYENHYFHGIFKGRDFQCEKENKKDIGKVKSNYLIIQFDIILNILHSFSNLLLRIYVRYR